MAAIITAPPGKTGRLIRIVAHPSPWLGLRERADRAGLRLRWDALTEDGNLLVAATEYPLADGAHVLLSRHGLPGDALITMRHEGAIHGSFVPRPLHLVAAEGARRAAGKARLADLRARHPENSAMTDAAGGQPPATASGAVDEIFREGAV